MRKPASAVLSISENAPDDMVGAVALFRQGRRSSNQPSDADSKAPRRSASKSAETHARHRLDDGPPYSLDSALHASRYAWVIAQFVRPSDTAVDLGCGTGFGVEMLGRACQRVVGVDLDPNVLGLNETTALENVTFFCDDACEPGISQRIGIEDADVVVSMETIEHLEDYYSYIENALELLNPHGTFVVGTPNRTMTYERYPERRHMDPSHVQEFSATSLGHTLKEYFTSVELRFQGIPGFWSKGPDLGSNIAEGYELDEVYFERVDYAPSLAFDAFALVAVCTNANE